MIIVLVVLIYAIIANFTTHCVHHITSYYEDIDTEAYPDYSMFDIMCGIMFPVVLVVVALIFVYYIISELVLRVDIIKWKLNKKLNKKRK